MKARARRKAGTARKRIADKLVASEERYRLLFERNPLPMWVYDRETLHFLAVNEAAVRHYGYSREEFRSMTVVDIRPEEEQPRLKAELRDIEGYRFGGRWKLRKKDGSIVAVEILSHDMPFAERPARVVLANDVTERLAAEEGLRRSYDELRALSARLESVREEESTRIAREVHDEVGQALTALKMDVAEVEHGLAAAGGAPKAVAGTLSAMGRLLDDTMDVVHRISTELRPGVLDELGLEEAVEWQLEEFRKRTGIACRFETGTRRRVDRQGHLDGRLPRAPGAADERRAACPRERRPRSLVGRERTASPSRSRMTAAGFPRVTSSRLARSACSASASG